MARTAPTEPQEESHRPLSLGLLRKLWKLTGPVRGTRNTLFALTFLRSIQLPLLPWAIGAIINGPITTADTRGLILGVLGYAALALFTEICFCFRIGLALKLGESVVGELRSRVFNHLLSMPMGFFHEMKLGRIISRVTSDCEVIRQGIQDVFFVSVVQIGQMIVSAALMIHYDLELFLMVAAVGPGIFFLNRFFHRRMSVVLRRQQESFSRVTASVAEGINGIRVTQSFVREGERLGLFRELVENHSRSMMGAARTSSVFFPLLELNAQFFLAALLLFGGWRAIHPEGALQLGNLIMFVFLSNLFFQPFQALGNQYNALLTAMAGAERVFGLLETPPPWRDAPDAVEMGRADGAIEFREITFGYDPKHPVLHDIGFHVAPGTTVALVGPTGSGKSSIINLVAKFYLPTAGQVLVDGRDITSIRTASLRRNMGIVQQHNFLFTGTVRDNLRVGKPNATDADLERVAGQLGFLEELREIGLDTVVGEGGSGISLGQRQLVCIARAMVADPRILIFDEATSAVDSITELKIQTALDTLLSGRTSLVIAHRLSTIRKADQVILLERGRIVERGTHAELVAAGGVYASLHEAFLGGDHLTPGGPDAEPPRL